MIACKWDATNHYVAVGRLWIQWGPWDCWRICTSEGITAFDAIAWRLRITLFVKR